MLIIRQITAVKYKNVNSTLPHDKLLIDDIFFCMDITNVYDRIGGCTITFFFIIFLAKMIIEAN